MSTPETGLSKWRVGSDTISYTPWERKAELLARDGSTLLTIRPFDHALRISGYHKSSGDVSLSAIYDKDSGTFREAQLLVHLSSNVLAGYQVDISGSISSRLTPRTDENKLVIGSVAFHTSQDVPPSYYAYSHGEILRISNAGNTFVVTRREHVAQVDFQRIGKFLVQKVYLLIHENNFHSEHAEELAPLLATAYGALYRM